MTAVDRHSPMEHREWREKEISAARARLSSCPGRCCQVRCAQGGERMAVDSVLGQSSFFGTSLACLFLRLRACSVYETGVSCAEDRLQQERSRQAQGEIGNQGQMSTRRERRWRWEKWTGALGESELTRC